MAQYFQEKALGIDHLELAIVVGNLAKLYARDVCSSRAALPPRAHDTREALRTTMLLLTLDGYAVVLPAWGGRAMADGLDSRARKIRAAR
jgi:hypothetical protein